MVEGNLAKKLKWLTLFRVVTISFLFGATVLLNLDDSVALIRDRENRVLYFCTVIAYAASLVYLILLRRLRSRSALVILTYVQLLGDVGLAGAFVAITGGSASVFTLFFSLTIINAAITLYRRGAFTIAGAATVTFLIITFVSSDYLRWNEVIVNLLAFFSIAGLASYLAEQVRRTDQEHRETIGSLEDLRARHEHIVASIGTGLVTVTNTNRISFFNAAAEDMTGLSEPEVIGVPVDQVFPSVSSVLSVTEPENYTVGKIVRENLKNKVVYVQWSVSPLRDAGGIQIGRILSFEDVTHVMEMQEKVKRSEQLAVIGNMSARIAHEIRNPLASISGCVELMKRPAHDPETSQRLMTIVLREIDTLNRWITDFLDFARPRGIETGKVDMGRVLQDTVEAFQLDPLMASHRAIVHAPAQCFVHADPMRLKQVFWNLLKNASQAMPSGGTILVSVAIRETVGQRWAVAEISDEGEGIADDVIGKVFEPFFTTKERGTGLGLPTCYRIVHEHGGSMELESEVGRGSTFRVVLPLAGGE